MDTQLKVFIVWLVVPSVLGGLAMLLGLAVQRLRGPSKVRVAACMGLLWCLGVAMLFAGNVYWLIDSPSPEHLIPGRFR